MLEDNHCSKEAQIALLQERIHNLEQDRSDFNNEVKELRQTQIQLTKSITELNTTVSNFKWWIMFLIAAFGGVMGFLIQEIIKLI